MTEGPFKREGSGNPILARHIERIKPLILHTGHFHSGNKKFCGECGDKLIKDEMKCTICGAKIEDKQKYCYECGTKVR